MKMTLSEKVVATLAITTIIILTSLLIADKSVADDDFMPHARTASCWIQDDFTKPVPETTIICDSKELHCHYNPETQQITCRTKNNSIKW